VSRPPIIRRAARTDIRKAAEWYAGQQRPGLDAEFVEAVKKAIELAAAAPLRPAIVAAGARRIPTGRFPYGVYYLVRDGRVLVIAVVHDSRNPAVWQKRADDAGEALQ
jgi:toxin ParE1/3/4